LFLKLIELIFQEAADSLLQFSNLFFRIIIDGI
jgi:hypothetical protein